MVHLNPTTSVINIKGNKSKPEGGQTFCKGPDTIF